MWLSQFRSLANRVLKYFGLQRIPCKDDHDVRGNCVLRIVWNESPHDDPRIIALGYVYYEGGGLEGLSDEWWYLVPNGWDRKEALGAYEAAKAKGQPANWQNF